MNGKCIDAMINAAKRAQTSAGWRSVQPFLAIAPALVAQLDGDDNEEFVPEPAELALEADTPYVADA